MYLKKEIWGYAKNNVGDCNSPGMVTPLEW